VRGKKKSRDEIQIMSRLYHIIMVNFKPNLAYDAIKDLATLASISISVLDFAVAAATAGCQLLNVPINATSP
jgi:hypothetical protein